MKERFLIIGLEKIAVAIEPERRQVLVELQLPEELIGLANNLGLMAAFSSAEAREFARALLRKADEAESSGGSD
jgi:hypothetical protein